MDPLTPWRPAPRRWSTSIVLIDVALVAWMVLAVAWLRRPVHVIDVGGSLEGGGYPAFANALTVLAWSVAGCACAATAWAVWSWSEVRRTRWELLVVAVAAFAGSGLLHAGADGAQGVWSFLGDASRFLGAAAVAAWSVATARDLVRSMVVTRPAAAEVPLRSDLATVA